MYGKKDEVGRERRKRPGRQKEWPSSKRQMVNSEEGQGIRQREVNGLYDGDALQLTQKSTDVVVVSTALNIVQRKRRLSLDQKTGWKPTSAAS